jgi:WD40 repeat protein
MKRFSLLTILAVVPGACGDPSAPREWEPIEIASPAIEADTVDAIVPIWVTIRTPGGRPVRNLPVSFEAVNSFVAGDSASLGGMQVWEVETDGNGRAAVWFRLGSSTAEAARLVVRAGVDKAMLEMNVLPGAAAGLRAIPAETALALTRSYTIAVHTTDRHGNPRPGTIDATVSSPRPHIAQVEGSGITVLAPGKAILDLRSGELRGTALVYGMPPGRLTLAGSDALYTFNMTADSLVRVVDAGSRCASWHPDGEHVLLDNLVIASTATGTVAPRIPTGTDSILAGCGLFSADGSWIYFDGRRATEGQWISRLWRIHPDGSQLEQIAADRRAWMPSPSPDGARVAYMLEGIFHSWSANFLVVATIGSAALDTIAPPVSACTVHNCSNGITSVRWSPTGEWIAYTTRTLELQGGGPYVSQLRYGSLVRLVRPEGSEPRYIGPPASEPHHHGFWGGVSWSPDGQWLVGVSFPDSRIRLVHLASGEEVMLNSAVRGQPAWADQ